MFVTVPSLLQRFKFDANKHKVSFLKTNKYWKFKELVGMTKNFQEINLTNGQVHKSKFAAKKGRMPIIRCRCGFEILVVPDLKAMNRAIENHVADHRQANKGPKRLTAFLTEQVLIAASEVNV